MVLHHVYLTAGGESNSQISVVIGTDCISRRTGKFNFHITVGTENNLQIYIMTSLKIKYIIINKLTKYFT